MVLLQGILDAYHYTVGQVEFYGPTNFSSILDKAMEYATHPSQDVQRYQILMIITVSVDDIAVLANMLLTA